MRQIITDTALQQALTEIRYFGFPIEEFIRLGWTPRTKHAQKEWPTADLPHRVGIAACLFWGPVNFPEPARLITTAYERLCRTGSYT